MRVWVATVAVVVAIGVAAGLWLARRRGPDGYPVGKLAVDPMVDRDQWSVYALEFARSVGVPARRLLADAARGETVALSWHFYVVLGHRRVVLVDTGTAELARRADLAERWRVVRARRPDEALGSLGLLPDDVTDILLTHRHWDHSGGIGLFPAARVHAQADEWQRLRRAARGSFAGDLARVESEGRLALFKESPHEPLPGVKLREEGGHTRHHCTVEIRCADRIVTVAGDAVSLYCNLEEGREVAQAFDRAQSVRDLAALQARVGPGGVLLPGHDPELFARFPCGLDGVARVCE